MAQELSFNKKLAVVKLVLSSLFARKQNYLVVNARERNRLLFTNIEEERVLFYRSDIEDNLMSVVMTDKSADLVYELFPVLKEVTAIIHMPTFLSTINKKLSTDKGVAPKVFVDQRTEELFIEFRQPKESDGVFAELPAEERTVVGKLITQEVWERYTGIITHFQNFVKEPIEKELTVASAFANDKVVKLNVEIPNNMNNCMVSLCLPVQDGTTIPSFREYLAKKKLPWTYRALIQYNEKHSVAKVTYCFRDDYVDCMCIAPGTLWFPYRKR